jgi:hypothetical protein
MRKNDVRLDIVPDMIGDPAAPEEEKKVDDRQSWQEPEQSPF